VISFTRVLLRRAGHISWLAQRAVENLAGIPRVLLTLEPRPDPGKSPDPTSFLIALARAVGTAIESCPYCYPVIRLPIAFP